MNTITQLNIFKPIRKESAHKGENGSVAIIGGSKGMVGAVLLAARAALLSGAGRVYASFLAEDAPKVDLMHPEIMVRELEMVTSLAQLNCVVIGPGLGNSAEATAQLDFWLRQPINLVIDADALNLISSDNALSILLAQRKAASIITPHPGEAARLLQKTSKEIQENRLKSALILAQQYNTICVLKGKDTVIAHHKQHYTNTTGNAGLASGGTGDVLSGIIGSLIAQGLDALEAAKTGVWLHGAAADSLVKNGLGPIGLTASEVALEARQLLNTLH
jgi:ADP-dependent NAD(P)H-hydrate dehydratase / NAD(P)H-hydrate epimerase